MSELEDFMMDDTDIDFETASTFSFQSDESECDGSTTIPLHPFLRNNKPNIITEENYKKVKQTLERAHKSVEEWGPSIFYVNDEFITYDLCKKAIDNHDGAICSIKPQLLTEEEYYKLCLQSISNNGFNMKIIPEHVQTQELCDAAIRSSCWALPNCLDKFKTRENCLIAVSGNGETIKHVPTEFINEELCLAAVSTPYRCLNLIPKELITKEMCEKAVKSIGQNIQDISDEFMSSELGLIAVQSPGNSMISMAGNNIRFINHKYLTKEIVIEAARHWPSIYKDVPEEFKTEEIEKAISDTKQIPDKHNGKHIDECRIQ